MFEKFGRGEWIRTTDLLIPNQVDRKINDLALVIGIETRFDTLFPIKNFRRIPCSSVQVCHNRSMHRVGIVLGIVLFRPIWENGFALSG